MKNILTEALVNSATNASFIFSYTNSAKLRINIYKTKSVINNITKSSLKILPPKKIKTGNVIYINLHILVLYLNNIIQNRH